MNDKQKGILINVLFTAFILYLTVMFFELLDVMCEAVRCGFTPFR